MGATTYVGRILRALQFKQANELWGAIGRTTVWDNEADPPDDPIDSTVIEETIGYVSAGITGLAKIVESNEDVIINGQKYAYVNDVDAYDEDARYLIIIINIIPSQGHPYGNFRQIGVYAGLTPTTGHEGDTFLFPSDVSDPGKLVYIHNDIVTTMSPIREEEIKIALEFR